MAHVCFRTGKTYLRAMALAPNPCGSRFFISLHRSMAIATFSALRSLALTSWSAVVIPIDEKKPAYQGRRKDRRR